jgi:enamine deaminase RidA (YjgF/YER057c/UK114 family)
MQSIARCLALLAFVASGAAAHDIIRHAAPNFPIATRVQVPAESELIFLSGTLADVVDATAPAGSVERFGDTATQAASVLGKLARELGAEGLTLHDVVKMNVFLVGDPRKGGSMDFEGLMKAWTQVYGAQPPAQALPARTTVQVAGLPVPGALVEIEAIAARHAAH